MKSHRSSSTSSTLKKFSISDREILDRRVRTNPRYAGVQARTNTGFNTHRRQELDREIRKYYKVRNDEVFRRISLGDLIQLMVTHSLDTAAAQEEEEEEAAQEREEHKEDKEEVPLKYRDQLQEVVHGMVDLMASGSRSSPPRPYLIVDVRSPHDFHADHITTAVNHPSPRLSRAVGWECSPLLQHKNRSGVVVVVCDEGEEAAPMAAEALQHRGYSNVVVLSGGVRLARDKIGPPLVTTDDDSNSSLPLSAALTLQAQLASTVLPPLTVAEAAQWWAAADPSMTARTTHRSSEHTPPPPPSRPKPWR